MTKKGSTFPSGNPMSPGTSSTVPLRRSARLLPNRPQSLAHHTPPMGEEGNPRRREDEQDGITISIAKPAIRSMLSPGTPFSPYSMKKPVPLYNWWLMLAERSYNGKRLCVQGICTKGKKSARIFTSTPIIKRHDFCTLEIANGITVIIRGVINKDRTSDNGFPLEVCNRFLIGFPSTWDDYTDGYIGKGSTSTSSSTSASDAHELLKGSAGSVRCVFPVHLDEFSWSRIQSGLTSMGYSIDNLSGVNFIDTLSRFCNHLSMNHTAQMSSDAKINHMSKMEGFLTEQTLSKSESDKTDPHESSMTCATLVDHAEDFEAVHTEEVGCHRTDMSDDGVLGKRTIKIQANLKDNVSVCSLVHLNPKTDRISKREKHLQKDNHLIGTVQADFGTVNHVTPPSEFVGNGMNQVDEELARTSFCNLADEILPKENVTRHRNHGNVSLPLVRKLTYNREDGNSSASGTSKSGRMTRRAKISSMEKTEIVAGYTTPDATTLTRRLQKVKDKGKDVQAIKSSMGIENHAVESVPVDHNLVNTIDCMYKNRRKRAHALTEVGDKEDIIKSAVREIDNDHASTFEALKCSDANDKINMNDGSENDGLICSSEYSVEVASQSEIVMKVHPCNDKKQYMCQNRIMKKKKQKTQYVNQSEGLAEVQAAKDTSHSTPRITVWTPSYLYDGQSPLTRKKAKDLLFASPESLDLRRSRSGRLLVPPLDNWCQDKKLIYNMEGEITGIMGVELPKLGSQLDPQKKSKKYL